MGTFPLPKYLRAGGNESFFDALTELNDRVKALEREFDMELTGFSPSDFPYEGGQVQAEVQGDGFTDPWAVGGEYMVAFRRNGTVGDPSNVRTLTDWTETTLTTAWIGGSYFDGPGSYDAYLIKSDDQGDPVLPYVQLSNLLENACSIEGEPA